MSSSFERHVAVFGGSFNPPHLGHRIAIEGLKKNPGVARVMVVPSFGTPLKNVTTPYLQRLQMARLAFSDIAEVSSIEEDLNVSYTFELLTALRSKLERMAFVIGTDQFQALKSWSRFPDVLKLSDWIVLLRKPESIPHEATLKELVSSSILSATPDAREWRINGSDKVLRFVETDAPEVSSTKIREHFLLPNHGSQTPETTNLPIEASVLEWIQRNHLYGT
jgi:nicotinate-nucleotide adenylyltransferase